MIAAIKALGAILTWLLAAVVIAIMKKEEHGH
jgi:hypothetical protein